MTESSNQLRARWCIVVADDHGPQGAPAIGTARPSGPVQYCRIGDSATLFHKALRRAARIAPTCQLMVTALEDFREQWEPALWFVRPENRFVCDHPSASLLTTAAALLSIAAKSPSHVVTVLPARCYVAQEWILGAALDQGLRLLPRVPEGVLTLGMIDLHQGIDEDYLVVVRAMGGSGLVVRGIARRPVSWVARHLREYGAMVASGILIGYAGTFAAHISRHWPGLTLRLSKLAASASKVGVETEIPSSLQRGIPNPVLRSLRWHPPSFPQRAVPVLRCGWSSLSSPCAVAKINAFVHGESRYATEVDSIPLSEESE
jgi:mannose-1-phosphate guanylyltransferase